MWNRMHRAVARPLISTILCSLAWLILMPPPLAYADVPPDDQDRIPAPETRRDHLPLHVLLGDPAPAPVRVD